MIQAIEDKIAAIQTQIDATQIRLSAAETRRLDAINDIARLTEKLNLFKAAQEKLRTAQEAVTRTETNG